MTDNDHIKPAIIFYRIDNQRVMLINKPYFKSCKLLLALSMPLRQHEYGDKSAFLCDF